MTQMPFAPDIKITELLARTPFTLSAEVIPPRNGASQSDILEQIANLITTGSQFLAVTKGAGGSLRGGSLPIAQLIKETFRTPCIAHFTCRDLGPEEVENQLMDHHYFGIRNVLALRGDPPVGQTEWKGRSDSYQYAYQLIEQIKNLNEGRYLERSGYKVEKREPTSFCVGAAAYPDHENPEERIQYFQRKVLAGAEYGITQMLFSPESYGKFLEDLARVGVNVPILPGTRLLRSQKQALRMSQRFGVPIPKAFLNSLPEDDETGLTHPDRILEPFFRLTERLKREGAPGLHLFVLTDSVVSCKALSALKTTYAI